MKDNTTYLYVQVLITMHFYEAYSGPYTDIYDHTAAIATTLIEDCYATIKTRYHISKNSRLGRKPLNKQTNKQTKQTN